MNSKTIKEFAEELHLDKKQLQNKLDYWKKKGKDTWNFSDTFSDGVRTLTKPEQKRICELLELPFFRQVSDDSEAFSDTKIIKDNAFENERYSLLEQQLAEMKSDKEYLKKLVSRAQVENDELFKANTELRILLQNSMEQTKTLQVEVSELSSENQKITASPNPVVVEPKGIKTPSEKPSEFVFNPQAFKKHTQPPTFEEVYPNYEGFFSELFKSKKNQMTWKTSFRRARRLARLKKLRISKTDNEDR